MKVHLWRTVTDHATRRRYSVYKREDGRYWVLATPTNPYWATHENVAEFVLDSPRQLSAFFRGELQEAS
jgi:hypothetical protein